MTTEKEFVEQYKDKILRYETGPTSMNIVSTRYVFHLAMKDRIHMCGHVVSLTRGDMSTTMQKNIHEWDESDMYANYLEAQHFDMISKEQYQKDLEDFQMEIIDYIGDVIKRF